MNKESVIIDEGSALVNEAISKGENWIAYNQSLYFIDKDDIHFFRNENEANDFANNNVRDRDSYHVIHTSSLQDVLKKVPYGQKSLNELGIF